MKHSHRSRWHRALWAVAGLPLLLAAMLWRRLAWGTTVIAISGSRGKTTTKELLAAILSPRFRTVYSDGSDNGRFGIPAAIFKIQPSTEFAIIEIGVDAPGSMWKAALIVKPDIVVITSVAAEHSENFNGLAAIAAEKAELVKSLGPNNIAVLNMDDPLVAKMAEVTAAQVIPFGRAAMDGIHPTDVSGTWPKRLAFSVSAGGASHSVVTRLVGTHWLSPVLAALATSKHCGVVLSDAVTAVASLEPYPGRLQPATLASGAVILRDEYNGSVGTLSAALDVMEKARVERKIAILSDFTDDPRPAAERLGEISGRLARFADVVVFVGENCHVGLAAALQSGLSLQQVHAFHTLPECVDFLSSELRAGDLALLKGRNADHLSRIYWQLVGPVACERTTCTERILCDECPELHGASVRVTNEVLTL